MASVSPTNSQRRSSSVYSSHSINTFHSFHSLHTLAQRSSHPYSIDFENGDVPPLPITASTITLSLAGAPQIVDHSIKPSRSSNSLMSNALLDRACADGSGGWYEKDGSGLKRNHSDSALLDSAIAIERAQGSEDGGARSRWDWLGDEDLGPIQDDLSGDDSESHAAAPAENEWLGCRPSSNAWGLPREYAKNTKPYIPSMEMEHWNTMEELGLQRHISPGMQDDGGNSMNTSKSMVRNIFHQRVPRSKKMTHQETPNSTPPTESREVSDSTPNKDMLGSPSFLGDFTFDGCRLSSIDFSDCSKIGMEMEMLSDCNSSFDSGLGKSEPRVPSAASAAIRPFEFTQYYSARLSSPTPPPPPQPQWSGNTATALSNFSEASDIDLDTKVNDDPTTPVTIRTVSKHLQTAPASIMASPPAAPGSVSQIPLLSSSSEAMYFTEKPEITREQLCNKFTAHFLSDPLAFIAEHVGDGHLRLKAGARRELKVVKTKAELKAEAKSKMKSFEWFPKQTPCCCAMSTSDKISGCNCNFWSKDKNGKVTGAQHSPSTKNLELTLHGDGGMQTVLSLEVASSANSAFQPSDGTLTDVSPHDSTQHNSNNGFSNASNTCLCQHAPYPSQLQPNMAPLEPTLTPTTHLSPNPSTTPASLESGRSSPSSPPSQHDTPTPQRARHCCCCQHPNKSRSTRTLTRLRSTPSYLLSRFRAYRNHPWATGPSRAPPSIGLILAAALTAAMQIAAVAVAMTLDLAYAPARAYGIGVDPNHSNSNSSSADTYPASPTAQRRTAHGGYSPNADYQGSTAGAFVYRAPMTYPLLTQILYVYLFGLALMTFLQLVLLAAGVVLGKEGPRRVVWCRTTLEMFVAVNAAVVLMAWLGVVGGVVVGVVVG